MNDCCRHSTCWCGGKVGWGDKTNPLFAHADFFSSFLVRRQRGEWKGKERKEELWTFAIWREKERERAARIGQSDRVRSTVCLVRLYGTVPYCTLLRSTWCLAIRSRLSQQYRHIQMRHLHFPILQFSCRRITRTHSLPHSLAQLPSSS